jgi:integrase
MATIKIELTPSALRFLDGNIVIRINENGAIMVNESKKCDITLSAFMQDIIKELSEDGNVRTSETYTCTLNSFRRFLGERDVGLSAISPEIMERYERYLKKQNLSMNTISFYMRILRAVYNRAVEKGFTEDARPFKNVYTGISKTVKRAIPLSVIQTIRKSVTPSGKENFARDMFLFSFYTRGMSFVDMAYLKKEDLKDGILTYRRKKTGQMLRIKWKDCMQKIIEKNPSPNDEYLLPIIRDAGKDERKQYQSRQFFVNNGLKEISKHLNLDCDLTMYVARHTWASLAKGMKIPTSVISDGMGHNSEKTTQIYLSTIDANEIDKANDIIIDSIL